MKIKPAVIITVTDGVPNCHACGDVGEIHAQFRAIKKGGWQGFEEAYELNARGLEGRAKFDKPVTQAEPKKRATSRVKEV